MKPPLVLTRRGRALVVVALVAIALLLAFSLPDRPLFPWRLP